MTESELFEIAEALAHQRMIVSNLGAANTPTDLKERVKADARYMIEKDKLSILEAGYAAALRQVKWGSTK